jgi:hypothetical protein
MSQKRYRISVVLVILFVLFPNTSFASSGKTKLVKFPTVASVDDLVVANESSTTYNRALFKHWIDADKDCFDTRVEVLIAESKIWPKFKTRCKVSTGEWFSVYDNKTITDASKLDVDHLVPLQEAWQSGADKWSNKKRQDFANDLSEGNSLIAVTLETNRSKGSKEPQNWLPTSSYVCQYLIDWIDVKKRWNLSVDPVEKDFLKTSMTTCTNGGTPVSTNPTTTSNSSSTTPTKTSGPVVSETGAPQGATAQCKNGTYSFSKTRSGTCSRNGGVKEWFIN